MITQYLVPFNQKKKVFGSIDTYFLFAFSSTNPWPKYSWEPFHLQIDIVLVNIDSKRVLPLSNLMVWARRDNSDQDRPLVDSMVWIFSYTLNGKNTSKLLIAADKRSRSILSPPVTTWMGEDPFPLKNSLKAKMI